MTTATTQYKVVPGQDQRGRIASIELRPAYVPAPVGASVEVLQSEPMLDEKLNPPLGWHWLSNGGYFSEWLHLQFNPSAEDLLQAALRGLNEGPDLDEPDVWDVSSLTRYLHDRTSDRRIMRYVEVSIAYLRGEVE